MKYIISESTLDRVITNYLDDNFDVSEINFYYPYGYDDETGEESEDTTAMAFYFGDMEDEDVFFRWMSCEYFNPDSSAQDICPLVGVEPKYERLLSSYFNDTWYEPFRIWVEKNFELPVKKVEGYL